MNSFTGDHLKAGAAFRNKKIHIYYVTYRRLFVCVFVFIIIVFIII